MKLEFVSDLLKYLNEKLESGKLQLDSELFVYNSEQQIYEIPEFVVTHDGDLDIIVTYFVE